MRMPSFGEGAAIIGLSVATAFTAGCGETPGGAQTGPVGEGDPAATATTLDSTLPDPTAESTPSTAVESTTTTPSTTEGVVNSTEGTTTSEPSTAQNVLSRLIEDAGCEGFVELESLQVVEGIATGGDCGPNGASFFMRIAVYDSPEAQDLVEQRGQQIIDEGLAPPSPWAHVRGPDWTIEFKLPEGGVADDPTYYEINDAIADVATATGGEAFSYTFQDGVGGM